MDQLTLSLATLVAIYGDGFRPEVFQMFRYILGGWIVCLGRRTISRVWETTGLSRTHDHSAAFRLFSEAAWNWDEICRLLILDILAHLEAVKKWDWLRAETAKTLENQRSRRCLSQFFHSLLVPGMKVWLVVDDTLRHKRGGRVAFGGIFLDAVLSTAHHKIYRFGNNWVTLGVIVQLPCRPDRYYCLNVLWRIAEKRGDKTRKEHRSKPQLAAEMVQILAAWLPRYQLYVVGDVAYVGRHLLKARPANVQVLGPLRWDAALSAPLEPTASKHRKKGDRLPTPREMLDGEDARWPWETICLMTPRGEKSLQVKVVRNVCWYTAAGAEDLMLVLVRDPEGKWRDEALLSTDATLTAAEVIAGYCRRWSVEVAYADAKGWLGFHEPQVWCTASVQRAHPMAWFVGSLVVLWYALFGEDEPTPMRHRPWYRDKPEVTFADMLGTCRYHLWRHWLRNSASQAELEQRQAWLLEYLATAA